jgi:hypothetical protein
MKRSQAGQPDGDDCSGNVCPHGLVPGHHDSSEGRRDDMMALSSAPFAAVTVARQASGSEPQAGGTRPEHP